MHRGILIAAAITGALGVALGAFGAHGLQKHTADPEILKSFDTAVRYQLIHSVALLALAVLIVQAPSKVLKWAGIFFITGIILFSGSLYLISYLKIEGGATKFAGPVTPLGGLFLVLGWLFLFGSAIRLRSKKN